VKRVLILIICILALSATSCRRNISNEAGPAHIDAEVVYIGTQCNGPAKGPSAEWVFDSGHLSIIYRRLQSHIISPNGIRPPEVDFSESVLLLIEMGRMPSAGYGVELADETVLIANGTAELNILWIEPSPEYIHAQVITSPCIIVRLPISGYTSARVLDQNRITLIKLEINPK
jgi:hypothetical protein